MEEVRLLKSESKVMLSKPYTEYRIHSMEDEILDYKRFEMLVLSEMISKVNNIDALGLVTDEEKQRLVVHANMKEHDWVKNWEN